MHRADGYCSTKPAKDYSVLAAIRLNAQLENEIATVQLDAVAQGRRRPDARYKIYQSEYGNAYVVLRSASNSSQLEHVTIYDDKFTPKTSYDFSIDKQDVFNQILFTQSGDIYLLFTENGETKSLYRAFASRTAGHFAY